MRFGFTLKLDHPIEQTLALTRQAEAAGFEAFFRSDHYRSFPGPADKPTTDAWAVLAGLARETKTIRLCESVGTP